MSIKKISSALNKRKLYAIIAIVLLLSSFVVFAPSVKPANAFLGLGDVVAINIQEFVTDLAESFGTSLVEGLAGKAAGMAINSMLSKYRVGSYLNYASNLSNQIYVAQVLGNDQKVSQDQVQQYIIRSMITDINSNPLIQPNLNPLYVKSALDVFDPTRSSQVNIGQSAQDFMAASGAYMSQPGGQYFVSLDKASITQQQALAAAQRDILTANGNKSAYNCAKTAYTTGVQNSSSASSQQQVNCALQNPGAYVGNSISGEIQGLFNRAYNPPDNHLSVITSAVGQVFAQLVEQMILGQSSNGLNIITDAPTAGQSIQQATSYQNSSSTQQQGVQTQNDNSYIPISSNTVAYNSSSNSAVLGASTSNYGTLYAADNSGNVITGSAVTTSIPVAAKQSYTVDWSASGVSGAEYVAFEPCATMNCSSSSDKLPLSGSKKEKMSGDLQSYTLQVWGSDASGNPELLETDNITVKSK